MLEIATGIWLVLLIVSMAGTIILASLLGTALFTLLVFEWVDSILDWKECIFKRPKRQKTQRSNL